MMIFSLFAFFLRLNSCCLDVWLCWVIKALFYEVNVSPSHHNTILFLNSITWLLWKRYCRTETCDAVNSLHHWWTWSGLTESDPPVLYKRLIYITVPLLFLCLCTAYDLKFQAVFSVTFNWNSCSWDFLVHTKRHTHDQLTVSVSHGGRKPWFKLAMQM